MKHKEKFTHSPKLNLPFPHEMPKSMVDQLGKFLTMVNNLEVTALFSDLISQVPMCGYVFERYDH